MYEYNYRIGSWCWSGGACKGADWRTFKPQNSQWATDAKGLFKGNHRVRGVDVASLQVLNHLFAKDSKQVYYIMGVAKKVVDPESFEVLAEPRPEGVEARETSCGYARDKFHVYFAYLMSGAPKILRQADRDTFVVLGEGRARDQKHVWVEDKLIPGADPATFELIDRLFSKDAQRVYYDEAPLPDADPKSFHVIGRSTGANANHVFSFREKLAGADPRTYNPDEHDG